MRRRRRPSTTGPGNEELYNRWDWEWRNEPVPASFQGKPGDVLPSGWGIHTIHLDVGALTIKADDAKEMAAELIRRATSPALVPAGM